MQEQARELSRSPHVVVATPGRMLDHLNSCPTFNFDQLQFLVLDEADRLLTSNQKQEVLSIIEHCPEKRQTLLFSATLSPAISSILDVAGSNEEIEAPFSYHQNSEM
jgi:ATP-dependent RNA helicase DDX49/DBP8